MHITTATRPAIQRPARASRDAAPLLMPIPDVGELDPAVVATVGKAGVFAGTVPNWVDWTGVEKPMDTLDETGGGSAVEKVAVTAVEVRGVVAGIVARTVLVLVLVKVPPLMVEGGGAAPSQILPFGQHPPESQ